jgi:hypothetical protein
MRLRVCTHAGMEWFAHRGDLSVPQVVYSPECVEGLFQEGRLAPSNADIVEDVPPG